MRFVADIMLGKLAKWLRVLGFDTHCRPFDPLRPIVQMAHEGRIPLTRNEKRVPVLRDVVFIRYNNIGEQLIQLKETLSLDPLRDRWFSRCIRCNTPLTAVSDETARDNVPEYVFYENMNNIRFCASCGRYFWPGSHRARMAQQLARWGFS